MTIWWVLLICLVLTILAFYKNNILLSLLAGLSWFALLAYTRTTPFPTIAIGSTVDNILMGIYSGMAIMIWLNQARISYNGSKKPPTKYDEVSSENRARHGSGGSSESPEEYAEKLKSISRRRK